MLSVCDTLVKNPFHSLDKKGFENKGFKQGRVKREGGFIPVYRYDVLVVLYLERKGFNRYGLRTEGVKGHGPRIPWESCLLRGSPTLHR